MSSGGICHDLLRATFKDSLLCIHTLLRTRAPAIARSGAAGAFSAHTSAMFIGLVMTLPLRATAPTRRVRLCASIAAC
jgi:hypothetical protein